jgi:hypothetical protein
MKGMAANLRESKVARRERLVVTAARFGVPVALLVLLLPAFSYPYLFDDYDFLVRVLRFDPTVLLPDPGTFFYRPISRELYFGILQWLSPQGPLLGHALNAAMLALACLLSMQISARYLGQRGGVLAGLLLAGFGPLPVLAAWVSGSQDALAVVLTLAAVLLELRGRHLPALATTALALLSKETAAFALPALALVSRYLSPEEKRSNLRTLDYMIVGILWAAVHPGIHSLLQRGFRSNGGQYVGVGNGGWLGDLPVRVPLLFNLPPFSIPSQWPPGLTGIAIVAAVIAAIIAFILPNANDPTVESNPLRGRFLWIAGLFAVSPMLLTNVLLQYWAPYYLVFPAIGATWLTAAAIGRLPNFAAAALIGLYFLGGVETRGLVLSPEISTERNLAMAASALNRLEPQFRVLAPSLPTATQVLIASQARGSGSVHTHLYRFQIFREWYRDPAIRVVRPERRAQGRGADVLFWINRDLEVFQIDLRTMQPHSAGAQADLTQYQGVLRAYSRGLAVQTILFMPEATLEQRWIDRRLAASYLLAFGRVVEGQELLRGAPPLAHDDAVAISVELLAQPTEVPRYDRATLEALGLDYSSPSDISAIMEGMHETHNPAASRFAQRLLVLEPGNSRAASVLRLYEIPAPTERLTPSQPTE